tara:strand:+ start:301 stop:1269 length:969 start_codon:yes stop_codon:yes gene_type:complete
MKKIETIIFTYNRAIMLDAVLESIFKNFYNKSDTINVIYQFSKKHKESYKILINKWSDRKVNFIRRKENLGFFKERLKYFLWPLNFLWFLRWKIMFQDKGNFKEILENIILKSKNNFITFVPDDQIFFKKTVVPDEGLNLLEKNHKSFFRFFSGIHFEDHHKLNKQMKVELFNNKTTNFLRWNLKDKFADHSWKYNFTIEGTVYRKKDLEEFLKPFFYHNPITLEAVGLWEARFRGFFKMGMTSTQRTAAGFQANNVQKLLVNQCAYYDPDVLMKAYLDGYKLKIEKKDFPDKDFDVIPKEIKLLHPKTREVVSYEQYLKNE